MPPKRGSVVQNLSNDITFVGVGMQLGFDQVNAAPLVDTQDIDSAAVGRKFPLEHQ